MGGAVVSERPQREVPKAVLVGVLPLQRFGREGIPGAKRMSRPRFAGVGPTIAVGVPASQSVEEGGPAGLGARIALMTVDAVAITVSIGISPLRGFVNEGITKVGPAVTVGVLAPPAVTTEGRPNRGPCYRRANVGCVPSWIIATALTVGVVPLGGVLRPCIPRTARTGQPNGGRVGPTISVPVGAAPAVERRLALRGAAAVGTVGGPPRLSVEILEVVAVTVVVRVVPLGEGSSGKASANPAG